MINVFRKEGLEFGKHFETRRGKKARYVVVHATQSGTFEGAFRELRNSANKSTKFAKSYHYIIDGNSVWELVDPQFAAYHAGEINMNRESLGVAHVAIKGTPVNEALYPTSGQFIADYLKANGLLPTREVVKTHREVRPKTLVFWNRKPQWVESTECPGMPGGVGSIDMDRLMGEIVKFYYGVSTPEPITPQTIPNPGDNSEVFPKKFKVVGVPKGSTLSVRSEAYITRDATGKSTRENVIGEKQSDEVFTVIGKTVDKAGENIDGNGTWLNTATWVENEWRGTGYVHSLYTQEVKE